MYCVGDWLEDEVVDGLLKSGSIDKLYQTERHQQTEEPGHSNQHQGPRRPEANLSAQQYPRAESYNSEEKSQSQHAKRPQSATAPGPSSRDVPVLNTAIDRPPKRKRAEQEVEPDESSKRRKEQLPAPPILRDQLDDEEL
jgi:hypothetical protein